MLDFICSSCGKRVQGDESLAGQRVQCPSCNAAMTAPATAMATADHVASANAVLPRGANDAAFYEGEPPLPSPSRQRGSRFSGRLALYGLAIPVIVTLIGLLIPAIQKLRDAEARTQSTRNLKDIGLAFESFHTMNRRLPYNGRVPAVAGDITTGSWAFMILPFLDENSMFRHKDDQSGVAFYMCPGRGRPALCTGAGGPGAWTDYFLNPFINDPNGVPNAPDVKRTFVGITDGASNTILLGHGQINPNDYALTDTIGGFTDIIFNGGSSGLCRPNRTPGNGRDSSAPASSPGNWGGPFAEGALMCMADGTVRMFPYTLQGGIISNGVSHDGQDNIDFNGLGCFLTPNGGECMILGEN